MLFFKQIKEEMLNQDPFKTLYERECHICRRTIQIIAILDDDPRRRDMILNRLGVSLAEYNRLKAGDHCNPEQVKALCRSLDIHTAETPWVCPRS